MKKAANRTVGRKVDEHTTEIKRYIGSVSDEFQHRVSAIGEQFSGLNKKLDEHTSRFEKIEKKLDSHTMMVARIMEDVEEIKSGMVRK
jgi:methyl-accepting chemotaxis protein